MGCFGCCCTCCGKAEQPLAGERIVEHRRCRDVLYLLLFVGFWGGMLAVCGLAFKKGNPKLLTNGVDKDGFICGAVNHVDGAMVDLTQQKFLYLLDPFELLSPSNLPYAKAVCVNACPTAEDLCSVSLWPCRKGSQFRCPYYRMDSEELYGKIDYHQDWGVEYYDALNTTDDTSCLTNQGLTGLPANTSCGRLAQLSSQLPGQGPCYPVWAATVPWFGRHYLHCHGPYPGKGCIQHLATDECCAAAGFTVWRMQDKLAGMPAAVAGGLQALPDAFDSSGDRLRRYVGDIGRARWLITLSGLGAGILLSLAWLVLIRLFAGLMVWTTVLAANFLFIACTLFCYSKAGQLVNVASLGKVLDQLPPAFDPSQGDRHVWEITAYVLSGLCAVLFLITLVMIPRLRIAIVTLKVATQAVAAMPSILLFPILPFLLEIGLVFYWIAVSSYLYSAGTLQPVVRHSNSSATHINETQLLGLATSTISPQNPYQLDEAFAGLNATSASTCGSDPNCSFRVVWDKTLQWVFIYHFFGLLWTQQFIAGIGSVTIAGAVAQFYWTRGDPNHMPRLPVLSALRATLLYHLGSVAFGSLIIAIIMFVRFVMEYMDRQLRLTNKSNGVYRYMAWALRVIAWLVQKVMQFVNRSAYIIVAVKGTAYCRSAATAMKLIVSNALRMVAVHTIGGVLIWLGKVMIMSGCGLAAFFLAELKWYNDAVHYPDTYLSSAILPILLSAIIGYHVAQLFLQVYEYAMDTIILSFCEDCEEHNGHAQYAPPLLIHALSQAERPKTKAEGAALASSAVTVHVSSK